VLTNTKQYDKTRKRKSENEMVSPRVLLMPIPRLLTYDQDNSEAVVSTGAPAALLEDTLAAAVQESGMTSKSTVL
jgi:hypothetical protein